METTFLSLPNEILTKFFENLSMKDRESLASINNRLSEVDRKSGYRRFERIDFNYSAINYIIATFASGRKTFAITDPLRDVEAFFNHASARYLVISGTLDSESEIIVNALSKTMTVIHLLLQIPDEGSCGAFLKFIQQRPNIHQLSIAFEDDLINLECVKHLLMNLPLMKNFTISPAMSAIVKNQQSILDDDVFLHLMGTCSNSLNLAYFPIRLTPSGIAKAFEGALNTRRGLDYGVQNEEALLLAHISSSNRTIKEFVVYQSRPNLSVTIHISMAEFEPVYRSLEGDPKFKANYGVAKHLESGATLEYSIIIMSGKLEIKMRGGKNRNR